MSPDRFVTDSSLDFLARRLRFLGYDVLTLRGGRLEELFELAAREGRIVLTLSSRHPRRFAAVPAQCVARERPEEAVRTIAGSYAAAGTPFSRCPECNTALQGRTSFEAVGEVPGKVLRRVKWLHYCPTCGKWYWDGSHVARLREWLERVLERSLEPPAMPPPAAGPLP